jgi:DNA-binding FadR family transcriptional regulator
VALRNLGERVIGPDIQPDEYRLDPVPCEGADRRRCTSVSVAYGSPGDVVRASRLHDQVVDSLGRRIITGVLAPGDLVLPDAVRAEHRVSASVVREAFRALQGKGLLYAKSKVGTKVSPRVQWNYLDPQIIYWRMESRHRDEQVAEFFDLRLALEPIAAQLMADHGAPVAVSRLRACITRMRQAMERDDLPAFVKADVEFHSTLIAESGNQMLATMRGIVELAAGVRESLYFPFPDATRHGVDLHEELAKAIVAGKPNAWHTAREMLIAARDELAKRG